MPVLDLDGLTRYDGKLKDYIGRFANWQKTSTAGAVAFTPVPEMPLDPMVNFAFTETGPASGTKAPDNPSTITGASSVKVTRCGKNLIPYPYWETPSTEDGITWLDNGDGTITASGTAESAVVFWLTRSGIRVPPHSRLALSGCPSGGAYSSYGILFSQLAGSISDGGSDYGSGGFIETGDSACVVSPYLRIASGTVLSTPIIFRPQLELGTTATAFEPYAGNDYTLPLPSTFYGGSIDLKTGVMTVDWGGKIFDGTESWTIASDSTDEILDVFSNANLPQQEMNNTQNATTRFCTHFAYQQSLAVNTVFTWGATTRVYLRFPRSTFTSVTDVSNWLASEYNADHPVVLAYKLYSPRTVQLTPLQLTALAQKDKYTPRLNTIYTDASAVQVGYAKSPIRSEYELTQAIIATEGGE